MASNDGSFVKEAIVLLDKFRASGQCLDDFIKDAAEDPKYKGTWQGKFILDAVCGCVEHETMLDAVISAFYGQHGQSLFRRDRSQFILICYLTTFALDDLGVQHFSSIIKSLDIKKMHTFLSFFFLNLTGCIQDKWSSLYDAAFVEKEWIDPLLRWRPQIDILLDQLLTKISQGSQLQKAPIKPTKPQEFTFTTPKLRAPSMRRELSPQPEKYKAAPKSTYEAPKEMQEIHEIRQKNLQTAKELLHEANVKQPRCANPDKSEHTKMVMSRIEEDFNATLQFDSFQSSGPPSIGKQANKPPIKLNKAALLRSDTVKERKREEELKRMEKLARGEGEPSSFLQWRKEMLEKDAWEKQQEAERGLRLPQISSRKAVLAHQHVAEQNRKAAQVKKEETAQLMKRYAKDRMQEEKTMSHLVQQIAEGHKNSKAAKEKLQKMKQSIVKEVSQHNQELLRQALEEEQADLCKKFEIIQEIHSIESLPLNRVKNFDDTETAGHRLMAEMSLFELKLRLARSKDARRREQEEKRRLILEDKQREKVMLQEKLENFHLHQRELAQAAANRKEEKKKAWQESLKQRLAKDETVLALRKELEEVNQEYLRWKQTEKDKYKVRKQTAERGETQKQSVKVRSWEEIEQSLAHYVELTEKRGSL